MQDTTEFINLYHHLAKHHFKQISYTPQTATINGYNVEFHYSPNSTASVHVRICQNGKLARFIVLERVWLEQIHREFTLVKKTQSR